MFTTSQASLKLYEHLDVLGEQVCYYDTDSVKYLNKGGLYKVACEDYLRANKLASMLRNPTLWNLFLVPIKHVPSVFY